MALILCQCPKSRLAILFSRCLILTSFFRRVFTFCVACLLLYFLCFNLHEKSVELWFPFGITFHRKPFLIVSFQTSFLLLLTYTHTRIVFPFFCNLCVFKVQHFSFRHFVCCFVLTCRRFNSIVCWRKRTTILHVCVCVYTCSPPKMCEKLHRRRRLFHFFALCLFFNETLSLWKGGLCNVFKNAFFVIEWNKHLYTRVWSAAEDKSSLFGRVDQSIKNKANIKSIDYWFRKKPPFCRFNRCIGFFLNDCDFKEFWQAALWSSFLRIKFDQIHPVLFETCPIFAGLAKMETFTKCTCFSITDFFAKWNLLFLKLMLFYDLLTLTNFTHIPAIVCVCVAHRLLLDFYFFSNANCRTVKLDFCSLFHTLLYRKWRRFRLCACWLFHK